MELFQKTYQNKLEKGWLINVAEVLVPSADVICSLLVLLVNSGVWVCVVMDKVLNDLLQNISGYVGEGDWGISITNICTLYLAQSPERKSIRGSTNLQACSLW